jgi:hypothetical protein
VIRFRRAPRVVSGETSMQNARLRTLAAASILVGLALAGASARAAIFTVTTTADSGPGSLRQAILDANASPGSDGISFAIPGSGVHTIAVIDPLPAIAESVLIDGYSQPGSSWNADPLADDAVLQIELVGDGTDGLTLTGGSSIVQGLALYGFQTAIAITQVENSIIQGCFIGTDAAGNSTFGNNRGVVITSPFGADKVGDAYPAARNLISGNAIGVEIVGTGGKSVINNLIGTDRTGTARQWNGTGVQITASSFCTVGGNPPSRNIISGNLGDGVSMTDGNTNAVRYNFIGTDPTGTKAVANGGDGIRTAGTEQNYLIDRNVVSGNTGNGITLGETSVPDGTREAVDWNKIGTADDGFSPIGNGGDGIRVSTQDDMGSTTTSSPSTTPGSACPRLRSTTRARSSTPGCSATTPVSGSSTGRATRSARTCRAARSTSRSSRRPRPTPVERASRAICRATHRCR